MGREPSLIHAYNLSPRALQVVEPCRVGNLESRDLQSLAEYNSSLNAVNLLLCFVFKIKEW